MDSQVHELGLLGLIDVEICHFFGIDTDTFIIWRKTHPSFHEALAAGRVPANGKVAGSLYRAACGHFMDVEEAKVVGQRVEVVVVKKYFPPDTKAAMFWMRNKA